MRGAPEKLASLRDVVARVRPVSLAGERLLPVPEPLAGLFPGAGLRKGSVVAVAGSTSLALFTLAEASARGSWCAAVGLPSLGLLAAAELGVVLERFPVVSLPPEGGVREWAWAVAALVDAFDVVLACPPAHLPGSQARRLVARVRERSAVLVVCGGEWPEADLRLSATGSVWEGLGEGHGLLRARCIEVASGGRGAAGRERRLALWLPSTRGRVEVAPVAVPAVDSVAGSAVVGVAR